jgi:magnesium transporter
VSATSAPSGRADLEEVRTVWPSLSEPERVAIFESLRDAEATDLFLSFDSREQAGFLSSLEAPARRLWARLLPPDDAADLVQALPTNQRAIALDALDPRARAEVEALLAYAEDHAGGLMDPRYAVIRPDLTADQALTYVRRQERQRDGTFYYVYVLDPEQRIVGVVSLRQLLRGPGDRLVRDIMIRDVITVPTEMDQEEVARKMAKFDLLAIPVIDGEGRIKGIITIDDVIDVLSEEATEDIHKLGGSEALDAPYMEVGFLAMLKKRAGWLTILFVGEMLTATAMGYFQAEISKAVVLALFIPLIISSGGNSGSQASTLIVRALAVGDVQLGDAWRVFRRELASGLALGLILATIGFVRIVLWPTREALYGPHYVRIALAVAGSLVGVVLWGTLSGSMLPFALRRLGFDPASASAPFVATLVDVTGLIIYFSVASFVLSGTLL